MSNTYKPLKNAYTRVFLIEGRARPDHKPLYASYLKMMGLTQGYGDITRIEMPDPNNYGSFVEVDRVRGTKERATTSLVGRYASEIKSKLLELGEKGCSADVQLHIGSCEDPSVYNDFSKALILEDVLVTNYTTEDMGALGSDENAKVDETADISVGKIYEVLPLSFSEKSVDTVVNQILDVTVIDNASCGNCTSESDGCNKVFAVSKAAGGSPATAPDIHFTINGGTTWYTHDIESISSQDADFVLGLGDYIVAGSNGDLGLHYALKTDFDGIVDPTWTKIATGLVTGKGPWDGWTVGSKAFIVGDGGYVYLLEDATAGVSVLDAGVATTHSLKCVHAYDEDNAIAGGDHGTLIHTHNGTDWSAVPASPVGVGITINGVWMKSVTEWFVTTSNGKLYYTINGGSTWTLKALPGTTPTKLTDIQFSTNSVGFVAGVVSSHGRIWRTYDGGYSWLTMPESGTMVLSDEFTALSVCTEDPNFVAAGGLADNGSDGVLIVGQ